MRIYYLQQALSLRPTCLSGMCLVHSGHAQRKRSKGARLKIAHNPRSSLSSARDVMHYGAEGYELTL